MRPSGSSFEPSTSNGEEDEALPTESSSGDESISDLSYSAPPPATTDSLVADTDILERVHQRTQEQKRQGTQVANKTRKGPERKRTTVPRHANPVPGNAPAKQLTRARSRYRKDDPPPNLSYVQQRLWRLKQDPEAYKEYRQQQTEHSRKWRLKNNFVPLDEHKRQKEAQAVQRHQEKGKSSEEIGRLMAKQRQAGRAWHATATAEQKAARAEKNRLGQQQRDAAKAQREAEQHGKYDPVEASSVPIKKQSHDQTKKYRREWAAKKWNTDEEWRKKELSTRQKRRQEKSKDPIWKQQERERRQQAYLRRKSKRSKEEQEYQKEDKVHRDDGDQTDDPPSPTDEPGPSRRPRRGRQED